MLLAIPGRQARQGLTVLVVPQGQPVILVLQELLAEQEQLDLRDKMEKQDQQVLLAIPERQGQPVIPVLQGIPALPAVMGILGRRGQPEILALTVYREQQGQSVQLV